MATTHLKMLAVNGGGGGNGDVRSRRPVLSCEDDAMAERVENARRTENNSLYDAAVRC